MNVSPNFSPPLKIMKPYFLSAAFFYTASFVFLLTLPPRTDFLDLQLLAWVHLYLIGFVMLSIFSAMSQLVPVLSETQHYNLKPFSYLSYILIFGVILLISGFLANLELLLLGGGLILFAMLLYAFLVVMTILKAKRKTNVVSAMLVSNLFLILGIVMGIVMAASLSGQLPFNPNRFLFAHTFGLIVGFVFLLIFAVSHILIPMFGSTQRFNDRFFQVGVYTAIAAVTLMLLSPFVFTQLFETLSFTLTFGVFVLYMYQLYRMFGSRKRHEYDIWTLHTYMALFGFVLSALLLLGYLLFENPLLLKSALWIFFTGFIGGMIIANLYKIIPFLVWFHIYSPLIETQAVPMLHELVPKRAAKLEFFYMSMGLLTTTLGLLLEVESLFFGGLVLLILSGVVFFTIINIILKTDI